MKLRHILNRPASPGVGGATAGFTLAEVMVSVAITVLAFSGILLGYIQSAQEAEWSGYSSAATALAIQQLEQARTAVFDPAQSPIVNQIFLLPLNARASNALTGVVTGYTWTNLDIPISGTNYTRATNFVTITPINPTANITVIMIQVDTVWRIPIGHRWRFFTNSLVDYYGPDNPAMLN
jgi:Tfp pilus assembly protein PilV